MVRNRLPNRRKAETTAVAIGGMTLTATVGFDRAGHPAEVFLSGAKDGSNLSAILDERHYGDGVGQVDQPRTPVRRSTLADANEARGWRIYAELAQRLIGQARRLYVNEDLGFDLVNTVYALDSTTIDLCLAGLSVGAFPHDQGGGQDAHAVGLAR